MKILLFIIGLLISGGSYLLFVYTDIGKGTIEDFPFFIYYPILPLIAGLLPFLSSNKNTDTIVENQQANSVKVLLGKTEMYEELLIKGTNYYVGSDDNDFFQIKNAAVQPHQLSISVNKNDVFIEQTNGNYQTHINGNQMKKKKEYKVYAGDRIQSGKIILEFSRR